MPSVAKSIFLFFATVLFSARPAPAQVVEAFKRLTNARSLKCVYTSGVQGEWEKGKPKTYALRKPQMTLHFDSIDVKKGNARLIGNQGSADIFVSVTIMGLQFVEETPLGGVNYTTVFAEYAGDTHDFITVTSRHLLLSGPFPSQRHGTCKVWD